MIFVTLVTHVTKGIVVHLILNLRTQPATTQQIQRWYIYHTLSYKYHFIVPLTMMDAVDVDDANTVAAVRHAVHGDETPASSPPPSPPQSYPGLRRRRSPTSTPSSPSSPSSAPFSGDGAGLATSSSDDSAPVAVRAVDDGANDASAARRDDPDDGLRTSSGLGATWSDDDDDDGGGGWYGGIDDPAAGLRSDGDGAVRLPRRGFWRTYDTVIMLSICSVVGIVIRAMSATWYRLEIGAVFSEDSALGTNLPLNVWSCFLLGLLCSGR